jgi:hypothetical protein
MLLTVNLSLELGSVPSLFHNLFVLFVGAKVSIISETTKYFRLIKVNRIDLFFQTHHNAKYRDARLHPGYNLNEIISSGQASFSTSDYFWMDRSSSI